MGFEGLLGNDRLKENLQASIGRGRISHFYLICGPEGSGKQTLARQMAAAILCRQEWKPCLQCTACRKVLADSHPDFITVRDPEHKNVSVKIVRQIRDEMFIRPNESDRKIYLFAQDLGMEGQNALLKILEEPPSYGVFILLTDNPEKLLTTIRSRATVLSLGSLPEAVLRRELGKRFPETDTDTITAAIDRSGGYLGQAITLLEEGTAVTPQTESFVECYSHKDSLGLLQLMVSMEKWKRDQFLPILQQCVSLLQNALTYRSGAAAPSPMARVVAESRDSAELLEGIRHLQKAIEYTQGNVSVAAVCGYLEWALR